MAERILALQAAEMIDGSTFLQAIGIAGGDVQGVEDPESILQIRHLGIQILGHSRRWIEEGTAEAMTPALLTVMQMQGFESLLYRMDAVWGMGRTA